MKLRYNLALDLETFPGDPQPPSREKVAAALASSGAATMLGDDLLVMDAKLTLLDGPPLSTPPPLDNRELNCILAALRLRQHVIVRDELPGPQQAQAIEDLAGLGVSNKLAANEIDALCEKLNTMPRPQVIVIVEGGVIQEVQNPAGVRVVIRDYDLTDDDERSNGRVPTKDLHGDLYVETVTEGDL